MIDEKKIEHEATCYTTDGYGQSCNSETLELIEESFKSGADWAIQEFLKDLWHTYDEIPTRKDSNILQFFESYSADSEDDFDEYFELVHTKEGFTQETWEEFVNEGGVPSKWLYIDDLFQEKGGDK